MRLRAGAIRAPHSFAEYLKVCAGCGKIRDEEDHWKAVEQYFRERLDVDFSHGFCESCVGLYPEVSERLRNGDSH